MFEYCTEERVLNYIGFHSRFRITFESFALSYCFLLHFDETFPAFGPQPPLVCTSPIHALSVVACVEKGVCGGATEKA